MTATTACAHNKSPGKVWPGWLWYFAVPLPLVLLGNYLITAYGVDLAVQDLAWKPGEGWVYGNKFPWGLLYHLGTVPAMVAVLVALGGVLLKLGKRLPAERNFASLYLALVLAVGPGLLANAVLKDHWGRPRPRDVVEYGGRYAYEPPLTRDPASDGKSFPCGHATMGFFFFAHYFIHRRRNPMLAWSAFVGAMVLGWALGVARSMQGGHFVSDTWWAMGLMWWVCAGLWYGSHALEQQKWFAAALAWPQKHPRAGAVAVAVVVVLATLGALLATPYQRSHVVEAEALPKEGALRLSGSFQKGVLEIGPGPDARLEVESNGHGMVWSRIQTGLRERPMEKGYELRYLQRRKGWFTELTQELRMSLPLDRTASALLTLHGTTVLLPVGGYDGESSWKFIGEGDLVLQIPKQCEVELRSAAGVRIKDETGWFEMATDRWWKPGAGQRVVVQVSLGNGSVTLVKAK